jgi:predicted mannosyl-3-phosphoglycerate phosphatase (HAD superfamily)
MDTEREAEMFDFNQLQDLDRAVCAHRTALERKRAALAKRPSAATRSAPTRTTT